MNKQELIEQFKKNAGSMSYFNAAEGNWGSERKARGECQVAFKDTASQLIELGVSEEELKKIANGYLVSSSDYIRR